MNVLEVAELKAFYGPIEALHGLAFQVTDGEIVAILGANGAGKTTVLRALTGLVRTTGTIRLAGHPIAGLAAHRIARMGVAHVPERRGTFPDLTSEENLLVASHVLPDRRRRAADNLRRIYTYFPPLERVRRQVASSLSGGEQQMLAIGRGLMMDPRIMLLDEPSLGLGPLITDQIFEMLRRLNREEGMTVLVVEQNVRLALEIATTGYVLAAGRIIRSGTADALRHDEDVRRAYLQ